MGTLTKAELRTLRDVQSRSKGLPVGIPVPEAMARRLVADGVAEWAPPMFLYPKPVFTIRLSTDGKVALLMADPTYPRNMPPLPGSRP